MKMTKAPALLLCLVLLFSFSSCKNKNKDEKPFIEDIVQNASAVYINGKQTDTLEASYGAFEGKQGDYIEFRFANPQKINTVLITEKTATVRQFNIFATIDGKETLIYTGKHILQENIQFEAVDATALKIQIVNTQIGNNNFIIQGINAYNLTEV